MKRAKYHRYIPEDIDRIRGGEYTTSELIDKFGYSTRSISHYKKNDKPPVVKKGMPPKPKNPINTLFFSEWSHDMAHLLGFILGDGCIVMSKTKKGDVPSRICIGLHQQDRQFLLHIKDIVNSSVGVRDKNYHGKLMSHFDINSVKMTTDVYNLGIGPNKSLTQEFPKIPGNYQNAFILGILESDGCIWDAKDGIGISFTGTESVCRRIQEILNKGGNLRKRTENNTWGLSYHGNYKCRKILSWIYEDSRQEFRMERKYDKYTKLVEKYAQL
uniref:Intein splicing domain protein n=1 Tax=Marseillevirus LCMAC101 TaxID=2506602 RepID=A0A481YU59_9VIRU|nr:MAG: intein splicing domain protein [Marseillevirus LCMAC101]